MLIYLNEIKIFLLIAKTSRNQRLHLVAADLRGGGYSSVDLILSLEERAVRPAHHHVLNPLRPARTTPIESIYNFSTGHCSTVIQARRSFRSACKAEHLCSSGHANRNA